MGKNGPIQRLDNYLQSINSMSSYLREIDQIPLLSRKEEEFLTQSYGVCCQKFKKNDSDFVLCTACNEYKEKLITANLRFVVSVAKKYQGNNAILSDLINEGNLGLLIAVDKFDHTLGYHFISYAVWWIKQSIMKYISEKSRMIRLPMNRTNELFKIAKFIDEYSKDHNKKPSEDEISQALKINKQEIKRILDLSRGHISIEEIMFNPHQDTPKYDFADNRQTPEETSVHLSLTSNIEELLNMISEREKFIIIHRFGLNGKGSLSLSKIGIMLGLTKERVRQLEKHALQQIRQIATEKQIRIYFS